MVQIVINGTPTFKFIVYDLDTQKSVIIRLAAKLKTLPKYLYFPQPEGIPDIKKFREKDSEIIVENLLATITSEKFGIDFVKLFEVLKDKLSQQKLDLYEDILVPFIVLNTTFAKTKDVNFFLLSMQKQIEEKNILVLSSDLKEIWTKQEENFKNMYDNIAKNLSEANKQKKIFEEFDKVESIPHTPFELERVEFDFTLELEIITIMELFNHVQLNPGVPFACINKFFKILKGFMPPELWGVSLESDINFKVLQKKVFTGVKDEDYTDAFLSLIGEPGNEVVTVNMSSLTSGQFLSRGELINRFMESIKGLGYLEPKNIKESSVNGSFYFPNQMLDKYVLAELIMNDTLFSSMMSIDESVKASKKKESVYIHFYNTKIGNLTANITEKISERNDPSLRGKDVKKDFKFGSFYVRVKIVSAENIEAVKAFQDVFAKLIGLYNEKYEDIVNFYREYIPNFGKDKQKKLDKIDTIAKIENSKTKTLKDIAPELFVSGYAQKCAYHPTIIQDDEVEQAEADGYAIMRYPKEEEGFESRNYVCNSEKNKKDGAIHPGLLENQLPNSDLFPYIPCCYTKNHNEVGKGNIFRHYYYGEKLREKVKSNQQDLIVTNKFVFADVYGRLPENIEKLFEMFDYDENYIYVRKGVNEGNSSFLECIMEAMYEETNILKVKDRKKFILKVRNDLATVKNAASCKQEMYDYTTDEIIKKIRDPEVYMDPNLFSSLLEQYFNCNIFIFSRSRSNIQMIIPRHTQAYYKNKRNAKCVFIYEHDGSTSDKIGESKRRCELIVRWGKKDTNDITYYSPNDSKVSQGMKDIYNSMRKSYALNVEIPETEFPIGKIKFFEQGIDSYGKCRMLRFKYMDYICTFLTEPMQPFIIPEVKGWVATKIPKDVAINLASNLKIIYSGQSIVNDQVKEIYTKIGNIKVSIPVDDIDPIDNVPIINKGISYPEDNFSVIDNHNKYRKLARYVMEYTFWMFSKYLQEDKKRDISITTINNFVKEKIKIDKDFEYDRPVGKIFDINSGVMDSQKLVVKSEETLKRLIYTLRVSLRSFRKKIENYYKRQTIENYYLDVTDFDQYPLQVILEGDKSVEKWIDEQKIKYIIHDSVQVDLEIPYFFQNSLIDNKIYLAQNTNSLQKAREIAENWFKLGFNIGKEVVGTDKKFKFKLYSYINSENILNSKIRGVSTPYDIKIMGYKLDDDVSFFTVLLEI
jgi:hypothetical protein